MAKVIYIAEKRERLKQNLIEKNKIEKESGNYFNNIVEKQDNELII